LHGKSTVHFPSGHGLSTLHTKYSLKKKTSSPPTSHHPDPSRKLQCQGLGRGMVWRTGRLTDEWMTDWTASGGDASFNIRVPAADWANCPCTISGAASLSIPILPLLYVIIWRSWFFCPI
jgi:hypothetical protein